MSGFAILLLCLFPFSSALPIINNRTALFNHYHNEILLFSNSQVLPRLMGCRRVELLHSFIFLSTLRTTSWTPSPDQMQHQRPLYRPDPDTSRQTQTPLSSVPLVSLSAPRT